MTHPLKSLIPFFAPYKRQIAIAGMALLAAALATLALPVVLRGLIDAGFSQGISDAQQAKFIVVFGVAVAIGVFTALRFYMVSWLGERVTADVRSKVYAHVIYQSPEFFETTRSGEVLSRLNTDTTVIQTLVGSSLSMGLRSSVMMLGAIAMLVYTAPMVMGLVLLLIVLVVIPAVSIGRRVRKLSRSSQDRVADASAIAAEVLTSVPLVQSYAQEAREATRYEASNETAFNVAVRRNRTRAVLTAFVIVTIFSALLFGLYLGVQAVMTGRLTAGELGQLVLYVIFLGSSLAVMSEVWGDVLRAAGAAERLMELLAIQSKVQSPARAQTFPVRTEFVEVLKPFGAEIRFDQVTFHYPSRPERKALDNLSFHIQSGETVALVGPSGAGKTTVFQLLQRFYDAQSGSICMNGVAIQALSLFDLRRSMALVPQESTLFSCSVEDNIKYGEPSASPELVRLAAKAAEADGFINDLPDGYQSQTGERGVRLSGGQKQRIAIARAMLRDAPLLLLDEATSALDAQSEQAVQQALEAAMAGRTTLVIAHRLATVQAADRILVLDQGRLVEEGTHTTLVAQGGLYAKLAALQFNQ
ncbi:MAG: ABC transporter transmembrane domain-containing protein [Cytophagales bacterium]|nr:ABC transporter transmembrane domain-containing protein [Cytophagales bacterium]